MNFAVAELRDYPAGKVCRVLNIPRSSYYDVLRNGASRREYHAKESQKVYEKFMEHHGSFGRRVLKRLLESDGVHISEYKISRILKTLGLRSKYGRKRGKNVYTSEESEKYIHENLFLKLSAEEREGMEIWSMDFTEEKVDGKKVFTCGIISTSSKILVGYSQSRKCNTALALDALMKAIDEHGVPDMIMTDRGSQFTSKAFYDMMESLNILHSMSRPHRPVDNRFIETFWKSMKVEMGKLDLLTVQTYCMVVDYYIYYYNHQRPHSSLGYATPISA